MHHPGMPALGNARGEDTAWFLARGLRCGFFRHLRQCFVIRKSPDRTAPSLSVGSNVAVTTNRHSQNCMVSLFPGSKYLAKMYVDSCSTLQVQVVGPVSVLVSFARTLQKTAATLRPEIDQQEFRAPGSDRVPAAKMRPPLQQSHRYASFPTKA